MRSALTRVSNAVSDRLQRLATVDGTERITDSLITRYPYLRMTCATVDCPACPAKRGELCRGAYGQPLKSACHSDRTTQMAFWRKANPKAYQMLKIQAFHLGTAFAIGSRRMESSLLPVPEQQKPVSESAPFADSDLKHDAAECRRV